MTVPLARRSIPPYLPSAANYQPTHPDKFLIQFAKDGQEFGSCLKVVRDFKAGETIALIENTLPGVKAYSSVQVLPDPPIPGSTQDPSQARHIELNSDLLYVNHSCSPNVAFDMNAGPSSWHVRALKDLPKGEIMTFAYFSTEWSMDQPFTCTCGSANCLGVIRGARDIAEETLEGYFINDHIKQMKVWQKEERERGEGKPVKAASAQETVGADVKVQA